MYQALSGLIPNTIYYIRSYITYKNGTAYGIEQNISTLKTGIPVVNTSEVSNITLYTAQCGGNAVADSGLLIITKGVCWNTDSIVNIENNIGTTNEGSGTGTFTSNITGLNERITYYVAAYATNEKGTAYGQIEQFVVTQPPIADMIFVAGGTFQMGSNDGGSNEQPIHTVTLSSFSISKYEITNGQYCEFLNSIGCNSNGSFSDPQYGNVEYIDMDDSDCQINYSGGQFVPVSGKSDFPVIEVSWYGANALALWDGGRLPTEAEWEFAARGGNSSNGYTYSVSNTLGDVAWYNDNSGGQTHEVGTKNANELGIHDMSGNVWEWCSYWYDAGYYGSSPQNNPQGPSSGTYRVLRGGSWNDYAGGCRSANRLNYSPVNAGSGSGFSIVH